MKKISIDRLALAVAFLVSAAASASAADFITPGAFTPAYRQSSDSPFFGLGFSGGYFHLETFEDDALNTPGVTATGGSIIGFEDYGTLMDSVDADDGVIDGTGQTGGVGRSYFGNAFTFDFDAAVLGNLPTHVGIVWTDGNGAVKIEAFDAGGSSLGSATGVVHADGSYSGTTGDDRFYGVVHAGGISRIILSSSTQEADHLQYGFGLLLTAAERDGNDLRLRFISLAGTNYAIQSSPDLSSGTWTTLPGTTTFGTGSIVQATLTNAFLAPQEFFRVQQLP